MTCQLWVILVEWFNSWTGFRSEKSTWVPSSHGQKNHKPSIAQHPYRGLRTTVPFATDVAWFGFGGCWGEAGIEEKRVPTKENVWRFRSKSPSDSGKVLLLDGCHWLLHLLVKFLLNQQDCTKLVLHWGRDGRRHDIATSHKRLGCSRDDHLFAHLDCRRKRTLNKPVWNSQSTGRLRNIATWLVQTALCPVLFFWFSRLRTWLTSGLVSWALLPSLARCCLD